MDNKIECAKSINELSDLTNQIRDHIQNQSASIDSLGDRLTDVMLERSPTVTAEDVPLVEGCAAGRALQGVLRQLEINTNGINDLIQRCRI